MVEKRRNIIECVAHHVGHVVTAGLNKFALWTLPASPQDYESTTSETKFYTFWVEHISLLNVTVCILMKPNLRNPTTLMSFM